MPFAVEQFDLSAYDVVLSDSASFAKGIITKPATLHISYCHTPPRYAWDDSHRYIEEFGYPGPVTFFVPFFMNYIRMWDHEAALRVDRFITNSEFVRERMKKYYSVDAKVIYPPVHTKIFTHEASEGYFLMVGRLSAYKKFDLAVRVFNTLGWPLKIVGGGPELPHLKKIARKNIEFIGKVSDKRLRDYYARCIAFIFPQEEDFGITAVEAMAAGKPVIACRAGGALETVREGETGIFFNDQTESSLIHALHAFNARDFDPTRIRKHAETFDVEIFKSKITNFVAASLKEFQETRSGLDPKRESTLQTIHLQP